ncbi:Hypothetical_protein [Hexamita inflata]|uniref:Hypothetical_protein n=1 Tax=Hexamita inflata TaxID=28002 RepID=A0AA86R8U7_9EUKA|nr:Hypothetical protein HINF_LOCUS55749 [Hexamita inflata]
MEYQKQFIQKQRAKEDTNASKPQEIANLPLDETMHQRRIGICKNKQTKKDPRYLIKLMNQCIKGNHHQAMPKQRINLSCKPKKITRKKKLRSENQFLNSKLANQVKLVRQQLENYGNKKDINASKPQNWKQLIHHRHQTPKLGIYKNK